jgi:hypothetical protein
MSDPACVGEGVMANHVLTHVDGPLDDLGTNAGMEGLGQPTVHQHDPFGGAVCQECSDGSAQPDGFGADVLCVMSGNILASKGGAGVTSSLRWTGDSLVRKGSEPLSDSAQKPSQHRQVRLQDLLLSLTRLSKTMQQFEARTTRLSKTMQRFEAQTKLQEEILRWAVEKS